MTNDEKFALPLNPARFETLCEGLDFAARGQTGFCFFSGRGVLQQTLDYRTLRERAIDLALRLSAAGIAPGSRVAIIAETDVDFMIFFFGCQYAGLLPVPLPLNVNLGSRDAYVQRITTMLEAADVSVAMAPESWVDYLRDAVPAVQLRLVGTPAEFYDLPGGGGNLRPLGKDDPCYIQYSSGSTALPRGVLATQRGVTANARSIGAAGLGLDGRDRAVSWLPLYHDMGLVGFCITPILFQIAVDYLSSASFARRPLTWLKLISERRATISFSPTFGYDLCTRAAARQSVPALDLSCWRVAGIGGEMIRRSVLDTFAETFAASRFDPRALLPSYGLAEATLAVSFAALNSGLRAHRHGVNGHGNGSGNGIGGGREFVLCGRPLEGQAVEIRDAAGAPLGDGEIGHIFVRGPNLMAGYYRDDAATSAALVKDGWLCTGDLGYLLEGELVVTGRYKDLIIHNGRNVWPHDIEWAVDLLADVRLGRVAAFGIANADGTEQVVVMVEARNAKGDALRLLEKQVHGTVYRAVGVDAEIALVPPRTISLTSSGKLSRADTRQRYESGAITRLNDFPALPVESAPADQARATT
jgi:fatty-acyl-CoA synthase